MRHCGLHFYCIVSPVYAFLNRTLSSSFWKDTILAKDQFLFILLHRMSIFIIDSIRGSLEKLLIIIRPPIFASMLWISFCSICYCEIKYYLSILCRGCYLYLALSNGILVKPHIISLTAFLSLGHFLPC